MAAWLQGGMHAVADQTEQGWFWAKGGVLTALRGQVQAHQADTKQQVIVTGTGLEHCTNIRISLGADTVQGSVVHKPHSSARSTAVKQPSVYRFSHAKSTSAQSDKSVKQMTVEFAVPWATMQKLYFQLASTGELCLTLTAQSDFYTACVPVGLHSDVLALQDKVEGMLSVCKTLSALVIRRALCNAAFLKALQLVE